MSGEGSARLETRALIVVSDLHLGEGRRWWDGSINLFEDFTSDAKFAEFLSFHSQAYDRATLILNGNFLHLLRFAVHSRTPDVVHEGFAVELVECILRAHPLVVQALRKWMENPQAELVYLPGDADLGILWPQVQNLLRREISDRLEFRFEAFQRDGLWIQHGHEYDPLYQERPGPKILEKDSVMRLQLPWGAYFQGHFVEPLRRLRPSFYRVRPLKTYLVWAFLFETRFFFRILTTFARMIWRAFRKSLYAGSGLADVVVLFRRSADPDSLEESAEKLLTNDAVQKVILGHSHIADYRQYANGKEYFNSGTWTKTISLDVKSLGPIQKLNYVLVEYRAETPQAKLMEWRGKHEPISDYL
jgi:UDP-2,3-diacylglucosamine pyrophosphatase LpxH